MTEYFTFQKGEHGRRRRRIANGWPQSSSLLSSLAPLLTAKFIQPDFSDSCCRLSLPYNYHLARGPNLSGVSVCTDRGTG